MVGNAEIKPAVAWSSHLSLRERLQRHGRYTDHSMIILEYLIAITVLHL